MGNLMEQLVPQVSQQFGISIQKHQLNRIENELENLKKISNLSNTDIMLALSQHKKPIIDVIIDAITVQESYFFRDQSLFNFLQSHYLPELINRKTKSNDFSISVLSAGCSRGEEIYSIAILLNKLLPQNIKWKYYLMGIDINETALSEASAGSYTKASMRSIHDDTETNYFIEKEGRFYLHDVVKEQVNFSNANISNLVNMHTYFDFILCRNVFIYLTPTAIESALESFHQMLYPHGALFLGASDFVSYSKHRFSSNIMHGVTYYTKTPVVLEKPPAPFIQPIIPEKKVQNPTVYMEEQEIKAKKVEEISKVLLSSPIEALALIDEFLSDYEPSALLYLYKAKALIACNDTDTALEFCELSIKHDALNAKAYVIKGLILLENEKTEEAKNSFQKALMIKKDYIDAGYYLAQIALTQKNYDNAVHLLKKTMALTDTIDNDKIILEGTQSNSLKDFISALKKDIRYAEAMQHER